MIKPNIAQAAQILRKGSLVAFPTETVYGLGADACNEQAINSVFDLKKRPKKHPLIVHIAKSDDLSFWAKDIPEVAYKLARAFWPGPLTLVLNKQSQVSNLLCADQPTIALRIPNHPIALDLLRAFGSGIAAPSANQFTHISPTTAQAVYAEFGDSISVLDGGQCQVGLESTILDVTSGKPCILRPGTISAGQLAQVMGCEVQMADPEEKVPCVPGRHSLHYAPHTPTRLLDPQTLLREVQAQSELPVAVLSHSGLELPEVIHHILMPSSANHYAHDLYDRLRSLDTGQFREILIESVPVGVEWIPIRDRLQKACGDRN